MIKEIAKKWSTKRGVTSSELSKETDILDSWPLVLIGFGFSRKPSYLLFIGVMYLFYLYLWVMASIALYLALPDVNNVFAGIHLVMGCNWVLGTIIIRVLNSGSINEIADMKKMGIYHYKNEDLEEGHMKILENISKDFSWKSSIFMRIYIISGSTVLFLSPAMDYIFFREETLALVNESFNPFLPHNFYFPFDTRTTLGFIAAYALEVVFWVHSCTMAFNANRYIILGITHLKLHLKVLNYSLENIQNRAVSMYKKHWKSFEFISFEGKEFKYCLHSCLKANIQHHQMLLRYKKMFQPFVSASIFVIFSSFIAVLYAALLYLVLQELPVSVKMKYLSILAAEQSCTFFVCLFGEDIIFESGRLFENLYETPWAKCDRDFKQTLHIMMTHSREPIRFKAGFLEAYASLKSYGELVKATYSIMNLIGPSNKMQ